MQTLTGTELSSGSKPTGTLLPSGTLPGGPSGLGGAGGSGSAGGGPFLGGGLSGPGGTPGAPAGAGGGWYWRIGPGGAPGLFAGSGGASGANTPSLRNDSLATTEGLRMALAPLVGCFFGLSQPELTVINMRAGFNGQLPHTRQQAARRLGTSPRQIRLTEQRALQRLNGLSRTQGCGGTTELVGGVTIAGAAIGPVELALSPSLVAFGHPGYQGLAQTSFSRLGNGPVFGSAGSLPASFGNGISGGSGWAVQLLTIMLLVALVGFRRVAPQVLARLRRRATPRSRPARVHHVGDVEEELELAPCEERLVAQREQETQRERIAA